MKRFIVLCLVLLVWFGASDAQTTLSPGELALIGTNCDNPDDFAFLLLVDVEPGTLIKFTDNGWQAAGSFRGGEGILTYTASAFQNAGSVLVFSENQADFASSGSFALSSSGDQLLVYQGDESSPQFIYGLNIEGSAVWQPDATSTNDSALPAGLTNGLSAVAVQEFDNVKYSGSTQFSTPNQALISIGDPVNWNGDDVNRFDFSSWGDFSLPVQLSTFTARAGDGEVLLRWITESERNNVGFEIWRADLADSNYQVISSYIHNSALQGKINANTRSEYAFRDVLVANDWTYWYKLVDVDLNGRKTFHGPLSATPRAGGQAVVNVGLPNIPASFELYQNFPNPFNPSTTIIFDIPAVREGATEVGLIIFNSLGQQLRTLYQGQILAGRYQVEWDGKDDMAAPLPSGVYYATLTAGFFSRSIQMVYLK
jgi:hypothetical protein